jgi:toxin HigB-1
MIKGFKDKGTERLFNREPYRKLPVEIQRVAFRKLRMLNRARTPADLRLPPANRLEALKGDRLGQHSIRINDRGRICFVWREGDVYEVEIVDYH